MTTEADCLSLQGNLVTIARDLVTALESMEVGFWGRFRSYHEREIRGKKAQAECVPTTLHGGRRGHVPDPFGM